MTTDRENPVGDFISADREAAFSHAVDAADSLRALQETGLWCALPVDVRRSLSAAAFTLEALTAAMEEHGVV